MPNEIGRLLVPLTLTARGPEVALLGRVNVMLESLQELGDMPIPFTVTELLPWVAPKPTPKMVIH